MASVILRVGHSRSNDLRIVVESIDSDMDGVISARYRTWYWGKY